MTTDASARATRRDGADTRRRALQIALQLFTEHGYERTSLRQIADELGVNKASLYYYFPSKDAILVALFEQRVDEAEALLAWVREQPRTPDLLETAVLRWVDSSTADKLRGVRFVSANPLVLRGLDGAGASGQRIGSALNAVAEELADLLPERSAENVLVLRMAILSINAAVGAAARRGESDAVVVAAARRAARALLREIGDRS